MQRVAGFLLPILLFAATAFVVYADQDDKEKQGGTAPEVPFALVYPAIALAGYGVFRVTTAMRNKNR